MLTGGNEVTNELARTGAERTPVGPEPIVEFTQLHVLRRGEGGIISKSILVDNEFLEESLMLSRNFT